MKYHLDYGTVDCLRTKLDICPTLIDLFSSKNYRGRAHLSRGRTVISLRDCPGQYIVIDKDHSTRFLIEEVVEYVQQQSEGVKELGFVSFRGYKMEKNKYIIHGHFQMFEMKEYYSYLGFDQVDLGAEEYEDLKGKGIEKEGGRGTVLFCKKQSNNQVKKYYFDRQLNIIKETIITEPPPETTEYFSTSIYEITLNNLRNNEFISTKVINYFFSRLIFAYYSQLWYKKGGKRVKSLESQGLTFFYKDRESLDFSEFYNKLYYPYHVMGKDPLQEQSLIFLPIYDGQRHFVLGGIRAEGGVIELYELDPLEGREGVWRGRLGLIIQKSLRMLKEGEVEVGQYEVKVLPRLDCVPVPRQSGWSDCGIFVCLYSLLLMQKLGLISLSQDLLRMSKEQQGRAALSSFLRNFIYFSYIQRNTPLLLSLQTPTFPSLFSRLRH